MKDMKNSKILKPQIYILILFLVIHISSCSNDKETIPDYIGTWTTTQTETVDGTIVNLKSTLTLSEGKYNENVQIIAGQGIYVDFMKFFCDMAVDGDKMDITITRMGIIEVINDQPTGKMLYYIPNDSEFQDLITSAGLSNPFTLQYNVDDNILSIRYDKDKNGQIDSSEITNYTRE